MCREVMLSGQGPLGSVHPELSRVELALARCFTCLFIFNINTHEFQFLTEQNTFLLPSVGSLFGQKPSCLWTDV